MPGECNRPVCELTFPPGMLPPVRAFWALSAHDPERFGLIESLSRRSRAGPIRAGAVLPGHDGIRLPATGL